MAWTKEQQKIIDIRDASILVSAAAGSGKTAVLVERILQKIMDEENKCDIDEFLVVTFTKAAASQMKEKISKSLEKALENNPDSSHLMKQLHLVNRADITTIDSFCLKLVKENFGLLNLDSSFTIADPGVVKLMQSEVLDKLFEDKFSLDKDDLGRIEFERLLDIFGGVKGEAELKKMLISIYDTASGFSRIDEWINNAKKSLECKSVDDLERLPWLINYVEETKKNARDALNEAERLVEMCLSPDGPEYFVPVINCDIEYYNAIIEAQGYDAVKACVNVKMATLGRAKKTDIFDPEFKEKCKNIRDNYKKLIDKKIFNKSAQEIVTEMQNLKSYLVPLLCLTEEFIEAFSKLMQGRKMLTFSDVEHLAFDLVCEGYDDNNVAVASQVGRSISERYKEIYIDEYQDSNFLQEDILTSVSRYWNGKCNMFMVGDVKQSIYSFRMARPDIFLGKYHRFQNEGKEIKVELRNNFRSRASVLNFVNFICYQLMGADLGGIEYNEDIALVPTKDFPEPEDEVADRICKDTELLVIDTSNNDENILTDNQSTTLSDEELNLEAAALEANVIADKIGELLDAKTGKYIFDEDTGEYRLAEYRDIVILLRGIKGYGDVIHRVLTERDIPVYLEQSNGYFNAVEIRTIMALLSVIDNSKDDINLAAVLLSTIAGFNESELAIITSYAVNNVLKSKYFYDKCQMYMLDKEDEISEKLSRVFNTIEELKAMKKDVSIAELIYSALEMTGYYEYASAMPMGKKRRANIDILIEKARSYEDGYYKGLFNFLRYIDKLKLNDMDFGEASVVDVGENVVRITSMHKSKGLEYPIVFVSGLGKQYNENDMKDKVIVHSDYYLAGMVMNTEKRFRTESYMHDSVKRLMKTEMIGEELRILYVALTRAKEKLILTGAMSGVGQYIDKISYIDGTNNVLLPHGMRLNSKNFLSLILAATYRLENMKGCFAPFDFKCEFYSRAEALANSITQEISNRIYVEQIKNMAIEKQEDSFYNEFKKSFEYEYPYNKLVEIRSKMSISDIKKMKAFDGQGFDIDEKGNSIVSPIIDSEETVIDSYDENSLENSKETTESLQTDNDDKSIKPVKINSDLSGTDYGTLVHKVMELVDFSACLAAENGVAYIEDFLKSLLDDNIISEIERTAINPYRIYKMISSPLGVRMAKAADRNELYKEQQFSVGIKVGDIYTADETLKDLEDVVIVQGIIDAFFYEGDEIVVMDYKTDRATEEELKGRYRAQLDYYASTIEKLTGKKVKEKLMYSFGLGMEVPV